MKETAKFAVSFNVLCHLTTNKLHHSLYLYTASGIPKHGCTLLWFSLSVLKHFFLFPRKFIYSPFTFNILHPLGTARYEHYLVRSYAEKSSFYTERFFTAILRLHICSARLHRCDKRRMISHNCQIALCTAEGYFNYITVRKKISRKNGIIPFFQKDKYRLHHQAQNQAEICYIFCFFFYSLICFYHNLLLKKRTSNKIQFSSKKIKAFSIKFCFIFYIKGLLSNTSLRGTSL